MLPNVELFLRPPLIHFVASDIVDPAVSLSPLCLAFLFSPGLCRKQHLTGNALSFGLDTSFPTSDECFATWPAAGIISCSWFLNTVTPELEAGGLGSPDVAL